MNLSRRQFLHLAACAARKGANLSDAVSAQDRSIPGRRLDRRSRAPDGQRLSVRLTRDTVPVAGVMNRFHVMVVRH